MTEHTKFLLTEEDIPQAWYNIQADLPFELPPVLHPQTKQPVGPDDLAPLFPMALIMQEVSRERWIEIPGPVRDVYKLWRPTPLYRAHRLEKALQTPAKIFYKYEGVSPAGSHKPNTAVAQAYYNKAEGTKRITTETGAGQWGSALALACRLFEIELKVYGQGELRAEAISPGAHGDLGCAGRAVPQQRHQRRARHPRQRPAQHRLAGHRHQRSGRGRHHQPNADEVCVGIGAQPRADAPERDRPEAKRQLELAGVYPDVLVGAIGGAATLPASPIRSLPTSSAAKRPTCGWWPSSQQRRRHSRAAYMPTTTATPAR